MFDIFDKLRQLFLYNEYKSQGQVHNFGKGQASR